MATHEYRLLEDHIKNTFLNERTFTLDGVTYDIIEVDKPSTPGGGECKTDCYVLGRNGFQEKELKISIKLQDVNEFQGNKLKPDTTESYFGVDWQDIVRDATLSARHVIENQPLIYRRKHVKTEADSITLGWKLEITDKYRPLSSQIPLSHRDIRDFVYKGTRLPQDKKDAYVLGRIRTDSGVAEYIIFTKRNRIRCVQDIMDQLILIEDAPVEDTYLIFTANNYRPRENKWEGKRYLSVIVNWSIENGRLVHSYDYDHPLAPNTDTSLPQLLHALDQLPTRYPTELDDRYIADCSIIFE
ncbi:hypothetical protein NDK43_25935 [Neobacillus pocheonensis]|uniref:Uncharacterized protein n=1 Tax=Neobacillus pocheonensis TaxID=363869 RepID=A0ABT0WFR4_9BACI|nr:hypothetical protein [Neobacillus pocheonensis]